MSEYRDFATQISSSSAQPRRTSSFNRSLPFFDEAEYMSNIDETLLDDAVSAGRLFDDAFLMKEEVTCSVPLAFEQVKESVPLMYEVRLILDSLYARAYLTLRQWICSRMSLCHFLNILSPNYLPLPRIPMAQILSSAACSPHCTLPPQLSPP